MTMRRTVMLAAVIAAVGLLLAGLPVAETTSPAQAQTVQHQTEWHIEDEPNLSNAGRPVVKDNLSEGWNRDVAWGRLSDAGFRRSDVYYTSASLGDPTANQADWHMGSRIGTQWIAVYIPRNGVRSFNATVKYQVRLTDRSGATEVFEDTINQSDTIDGAWVNLRHPRTGIKWVLNGDEVTIRVKNNEAGPHFSQGNDPSRMGINAAAMRCAANCTTTAPPAPPTTAPPAPPTTTPRTSVEGPKFEQRTEYASWRERLFGREQSYITATRSFITIDGQNIRAGTGGRAGTRGGVVSPDTWGDIQNLSHSGKSWIAEGARVEDPRVRVLDDASIKADTRSRVRLDGQARIYERAIVGGKISKRSHLSTIVQVYDEAKVYGDAQVADNARVYDEAEVYDRARVYGDAQVFSYQDGKKAEVYGDAHVYGQAKVYRDAHVYGEAHVYDGAHVHGNAHVYGEAHVAGSARVWGNARVCGNARVYGYVSGNAHVTTGTVPRGERRSRDTGERCPD